MQLASLGTEKTLSLEDSWAEQEAQGLWGETAKQGW